MQNGGHFEDQIFIYMSLNENIVFNYDFTGLSSQASTLLTNSHHLYK